MKKACAFFFVFAALSILLGHSIVPHHHYDQADVAHFHHHHGSDHDHHHDQGDHGPDLPFSHFEHGQADVVYIQNTNSVYAFVKQAIAMPVVVVSSPPINVLERMYLPPPYVPICCQSHHILSAGLRAPPVINV